MIDESRNQPIPARVCLGSKRSIGRKLSCRGASRNIWPGDPPRWPWRFGMTGGVARIFGGKNIFSRADGEDDRSEIQKDAVATKSSTSSPPIFLPKNILALLPPSSRPQSLLFEHREQWIEDRFQTLSECFAASGCDFAVMDNHLHVLVRLELDSANGWPAEGVVRRWLVTDESRNPPNSARDWLGSQRLIEPGKGARNRAHASSSG